MKERCTEEEDASVETEGRGWGRVGETERQRQRKRESARIGDRTEEREEQDSPPLRRKMNGGRGKG